MERDDYFFGSPKINISNKVYALIIYDITDDKMRTKFAKLLNGYGNRIQKSGFEINVNRSKFDKLLKQISKYCGNSDSIRIYKINGRSEVIKFGVDNTPNQEDVTII